MPLTIPTATFKDVSLVSRCTFLYQMVSQLSVFSVMNADYQLLVSFCCNIRCISKHIMFGFVPRCFEVSYVDAISAATSRIRSCHIVHSSTRWVSEVISCEQLTEQKSRLVETLKLVNFKSSRVASVTALLFITHFFGSNRSGAKRSYNW